MKTTLYYFSATGNSLSLARSLAAELDDAACMAIPKAMEDGHSDAITPGIGLIFPVYSWGPPRIVTDFARKITPRNGQYVFAVATCGGTPGGAMLLLEDTLKHNGVTLDAGFVVSEGSYNVIPEIFLMHMMKTLGKQKPTFQPGKSGKERLSEIAAVVKNRQKHGLEANAWAANFFGSILHNPALNSFKTADKDFWVEDTCNLCRICERVCPHKNITIEHEKHVWHHNCERCFACLQWCPKHAIQFAQKSVNNPRGHHPEVTLKDMLLWARPD
jgi:ferredoxin